MNRSTSLTGLLEGKRSLIAIVLVAAIICSLGGGWPFDYILSKGRTFWFFQIVGLAAFVATSLRAKSARQAGYFAWIFATTWLTSTFWWLYVAMHTYGGMPSALAALAVVALAGALGIYYGLAVWAWRTWGSAGTLTTPVGFSAVWMMAEMARGTWLTGFGWGAMGYAQVEGPLAFYFPWVGSYGVSALAAVLAASWADACLNRRWTVAVVLTSTLLMPSLLPEYWNTWTTPTGSLKVTLLQGNIPQDEKFEPGSGVPIALQWYRESLMRSDGDLVVAPETAIPLLPQQLPEGYWEEIASRYSRGSPSALIGIPLGSFKEGYTNSVIGLSAGSPDGWQYDKHHLVPFGEFIPPMFKWFTELMNIPLGDFKRGPLGQASLAVRGEQVAPNICYEDLYGEELASRFSGSNHPPTMFANVSNMGWFGNTVALQQHLTISRVRALEFQRPFVRATNTGATAFLSYKGEVQSMLPPQTRGVLQGEVQGRTGLTPFAWWASRMGLWPLWIIGVLVMWWTSRLRHTATTSPAPTP